MGDYRITISMPCFGRPKRTVRGINSILEQTITDYEALIVGDGCPVFQNIIDNRERLLSPVSSGAKLVLENLPKNYGSYGYHITNMNIQRAEGEYFLFMANDDLIEPNHFEQRLKYIEDTEYDFVYFNTRIRPDGGYVRKPILERHCIGHSELIIKTSFLKSMPPHRDKYEHDWDLVGDMLSNGAKCRYIDKSPTYTVMSFRHDEEEID